MNELRARGCQVSDEVAATTYRYTIHYKLPGLHTERVLVHCNYF